MQRLALFSGALAILLAAALSYLAAVFLADYVERSSASAVRAEMSAEGFDWVSVRTDGLVVFISGPAPSESARFNALALAKKTVNANRVSDAINVIDPNDLRAPRFSLELLRNGDGISLIGLIPEVTGRAEVLQTIGDISAGTTVTDMLETADFPTPAGWDTALAFALDSLRNLPRSKISVTPQQVTITAITDSQRERQAIEDALNAARPDGLELLLHITAPRPVITPFSLRFIIDATGTRFDSCSADSEASRARILSAARKAGLNGEVVCTIGLGTPTPRWGEAVAAAISTLKELGGGTLTFSDADITLISNDSVEQIDFDRVVYNLEQILPDVFSVHAVLPPKPVLEGEGVAIETPEFTATRSPEGLVQLRGRMRDLRSQTSVGNFARAAFGGGNVFDTTRIDSSLPDGWASRVLAGLESLALLQNGILTVEPDTLSLRGVSNRPETRTEVTQILAAKLGDSSSFAIDITYKEALNRQEVLPSPEECVTRINDILKEQQIVFAPSSSRIEGEALEVVQRIAEAMRKCSEIEMEIGGYTDSQGRESMNLTLSQARAEAVLDALLNLEVLTSALSAKGYGERQPIADNSTEEGRKANRRIVFRLVGKHAEQAAEAGKEEAGEQNAPAEAEEPHPVVHPEE